MLCEGCGNQDARFVRVKFVPTEKDERGKVLKSEKIEACDQCQNVKPQYPRDAAGGRVDVPTGYSKYSYAVGEQITGSRQYSEILKKNDLAIKDNI